MNIHINSHLTAAANNRLNMNNVIHPRVVFL